MTLWDTIKQNIFAGESGGDYNALFGYSNRPGGAFEGKPITQMTVDEALQFANPSGQYGQWVKGQIGRVATPMGAYQVVGTTLRDAKRGLGLTGSERMTPELQDRIGQWIYQTQGTGAWEGYKPNAAAQSVASDTMTSLGLKPQQTEAKPMAGLLGDMPQQQAPQKKSFWDNLGPLSDPDRRARLAMALEGMTMNPNQSLIQSLGKGIETRAGERKTAEAQNRTIAMLEKMGADPKLIELAKAGYASEAISQAFAKPKTQDPYSTIGKLQADLAAGRISKEQYDVAVQGMAPTGMAIETLPDGTVRVIQGAGAAKLTEGQGKATGFYGRAQASNEILSGLEKEGTNLYNSIVSNVPLAGNYLISEEYQKYSQAKRDFINAVLRQESGAVIGPSEFANAEQQYFPQPGDGPQVIEQKRRNREAAIAGLKVASGPGASQVGQTPPPAPTAGGFSVTGKVGN